MQTHQGWAAPSLRCLCLFLFSFSNWKTVTSKGERGGWCWERELWPLLAISLHDCTSHGWAKPKAEAWPPSRSLTSLQEPKSPPSSPLSRRTSRELHLRSSPNLNYPCPKAQVTVPPGPISWLYIAYVSRKSKIWNAVKFETFWMSTWHQKWKVLLLTSCGKLQLKYRHTKNIV